MNLPIVLAALLFGSSPLLAQNLSHEYNTLYTGGQTSPTISMLQLLANPAAYDGQRIRFVGFFHREFGESGVYLHREDSDEMLAMNAVWINFPADISPNLLDRLQDRYVACEGLFTAKFKGHAGAFNGELADIHLFADHPARNEGPVPQETIIRDAFRATASTRTTPLPAGTRAAHPTYRSARLKILPSA